MATPLETRLQALDQAIAALTDAEGILGGQTPSPERDRKIGLLRKARAKVLKARTALGAAASVPTVAKSDPADGGLTSALAMLQRERPWRSAGAIHPATKAPARTVAKVGPPPADVQSDGGASALTTLRAEKPWRGGRS